MPQQSKIQPERKGSPYRPFPRKCHGNSPLKPSLPCCCSCQKATKPICWPCQGACKIDLCPEKKKTLDDHCILGGMIIVRRIGSRVSRIKHERTADLGEMQALDVLSRQPNMPPPLDLDTLMPQSQFFEFDTTNLFLLGSPAGFFLLLERGSLTPRNGRQKPGAEAAVSLLITLSHLSPRCGSRTSMVTFPFIRRSPLHYHLLGSIHGAI